MPFVAVEALSVNDRFQGGAMPPLMTTNQKDCVQYDLESLGGVQESQRLYSTTVEIASEIATRRVDHSIWITSNGDQRNGS